MSCHLNAPIRQNDWAGLRVWLIGASAGIGASLVEQLAGLGARLIMSARSSESLERVAAICRKNATNADLLILPFDVCDEHAIKIAVSEVKAHWGGVDLVIYNAGTYEATRVDNLVPLDTERALRVNLLAPITVTSIVLPLLLESAQSGRPQGIGFVASVAGYRGLPRALTYGPGKAGLISFAESLWVDLNGLGLNTWLINPGFVRTRLTAQNTFEMPALMEPEAAASAIIGGFASGSFEIHFPKRFTWFMKLLRLLPIGWYLRLSRRLVPRLSKQDILRKQPSRQD